MPKLIELDGREYVILPREEYDRMALNAPMGTLAGAEDFDPFDNHEGPPMPEADADGHYPAAETGRAIIARRLIHDRKRRGLTQTRLAELAGVRAETINRIELGKNAASVRTMEKIDAALRKHDAGDAIQ